MSNEKRRNLGSSDPRNPGGGTGSTGSAGRRARSRDPDDTPRQPWRDAPPLKVHDEATDAQRQEAARRWSKVTVERGGPASRLKPELRAAIVTLLTLSVIAALYYHTTRWRGLHGTALLFVGLPVTICLAVTFLTRARSVYGRVLQANVIFLCLVSPLMGEGSICILMISPLFIGVSMLATLLVMELRRAFRAQRRGRMIAVGLPGLLLLAAVSGGFESPDELQDAPLRLATSEVVVPGSLPRWRDAVRAPVAIVPHESLLLDLGFPEPLAYCWEDGVLVVPFSEVEGVQGCWRVAAEPLPEGVRFVRLEDSSKLGRWLDWIDHRVSVQDAGAGRVRLVQVTRFRSQLGPRWYFEPLMEQVWRAAHDLSRRCWQASLR
ncbi:MAG: hypothetical protein DRQ55_15330 [Planctomycetota bacterium]|nr:MAG: hypothetical protein DRQ55_15330 [Planctomycetota bacterium]